MYSIGIKIPTQIKGHLQLFDDFMRKCVKVVTMTDSVFITWKSWIKSYSLNLDVRGCS